MDSAFIKFKVYGEKEEKAPVILQARNECGLGVGAG